MRRGDAVEGITNGAIRSPLDSPPYPTNLTFSHQVLRALPTSMRSLLRYHHHFGESQEDLMLHLKTRWRKSSLLALTYPHAVITQQYPLLLLRTIPISKIEYLNNNPAADPATPQLDDHISSFNTASQIARLRSEQEECKR